MLSFELTIGESWGPFEKQCCLLNRVELDRRAPSLGLGKWSITMFCFAHGNKQ